MKFAEARKAMAKSLRDGSVPTLHPESTPSLELFAKMCDVGFLTTDSQEGRIIRGTNKMTNSAFVIKERSYVMGLMLMSAIPDLIKRVGMAGMVAFWAQVIPDEGFPSSSFDIPLTTVTTSTGDKVATHMSLCIPDAMIVHQLQEAHVDAKERSKIGYVVCFDPTWGSKGRNRVGLFNVILQSLV